MTLQEARIDFTRCLGALILFAVERRYDLMLDEVKRTTISAQWNAAHCRIEVGGKRCEKPADDPVHHGGHAFKPIGILHSVHMQALAADAYIMVDGKISNDRGGYETLGDYWKTLHPLARWGGDFKGFPDLGHFSFTWDGKS